MSLNSFQRISIIGLLSLSCMGAIRSNIQTSYSTSKSKVVNLKKSIQKIEDTLNSKNSKYLTTVKNRQKVDLEIYELQRELTKSSATLVSKREELEKQHKHLLLAALDNVSAIELMEKKIVLLRLSKAKKTISSQIENEKKLLESIESLKYKFQEVLKVENDLYDLLSDLEKKKQEAVQDYITESEKLASLKGELRKSKAVARAKSKARAKAKSKARKSKVAKSSPSSRKSTSKTSRALNLNADFLNPLESFVSQEFDKKGITYNVKDIQKVSASKAGKISYIGALANYGNVIMIDHGQDVRSIYLGDFSPVVKKGDSVATSQLIANTRRSIKKGTMAKVYFEVRQKNKVQNTIKLVKNNQTKI